LHFSAHIRLLSWRAPHRPAALIGSERPAETVVSRSRGRV
jgi:hypothetical protein